MSTKMIVNRFFKDTRGANLVEYIILVGVIALIAIAGFKVFGGDVKLLAAVGAVLRPQVGIEAEFYAILAAAIFALGRFAFEGKLFKILGNTLTIAINPFLPEAKRRKISPEMMTQMRFGPAI